MSPPILGYPDCQQPFELHTDASAQGLGAVRKEIQRKSYHMPAELNPNLKITIQHTS